MRKMAGLVALILGASMFVACEKEKKHTVNNIIVPPREVVTPDTIIHQMNGVESSDQAEWLGSVYHVDTRRYTSDSLSYITNNGRRYRNNIINVVIRRKDGSVFFERKFTKSAFENLLDKDYYEKNVLLGLVYNGIDNDRLVLLGSVGNPDILTEEFVPFNVYITRMGEVSIEKAILNVPENDSTEVDLNEGV